MYSINSECLLGLRLHAECFMENQEEKNWLCPQEAYNLVPLFLKVIPISGEKQPVMTISWRIMERNASVYIQKIWFFQSIKYLKMQSQEKKM